MSVDVYVTSPQCCSGHAVNFTYNYSPLLREVGFPAWKFLDGLPADIVGILVGRASLEIQTRRDDPKLAELIRGGGTWGTVETLLESMRTLLAACDKHREGEVRVSG